jgi:hypothetical protein
MDEREQNEEQVEDLEMREAEAENVKGGFSWSENQTGSAGLKARPAAGDINGVDGGPQNHNQILIQV